LNGRREIFVTIWAYKTNPYKAHNPFSNQILQFFSFILKFCIIQNHYQKQKQIEEVTATMVAMAMASLQSSMTSLSLSSNSFFGQPLSPITLSPLLPVLHSLTLSPFISQICFFFLN